MMKQTETYYRVWIQWATLLFFWPAVLWAQESPATLHIRAKSAIMDENTIRIRWSPADINAWSDGRKYGYVVEKYTLMVDGLLLDTPEKQVVQKPFTPAPLADWAKVIEQSNYAAVMAQAFYGERFELSSSMDVGALINQSNELEQRFAVSIFMAEYDYSAAGLAGWAWTDSLAKPNEKYLYRICLNRPQPLEGDTVALFTGFDDKKSLPQPLGLQAVWGDHSVMLSWNYILLSDIYHSYHVEKRYPGEDVFHRITALPVTALGEEDMELLYTDSLQDNEQEYAYRIIGITGFEEEGPPSDTIRGQGKKRVSCIPQIYGGDFIAAGQAVIAWEFECSEPALVDEMQIWRSGDPEGTYEKVAEHISIDHREFMFHLDSAVNYVKVRAVYKDSAFRESFPYLLRQVDSIPPAIPSGLKVSIDTLGVAHLSWDANPEPDLRGYRILRGFTADEEMSSILPDFLSGNEYADTLSLELGNAQVYYALTALDVRYNESRPSAVAVASKPNRITPDEPVFAGYEFVGDHQVLLTWLTERNNPDVQYALLRSSVNNPGPDTVLFAGDGSRNSYTDLIGVSGTYRYTVVATGANGLKSFSPQAIELDIQVSEEANAVSGFRFYVDRNHHYIELFWRKHEKAKLYRIYKAESDGALSLWKEPDASVNRIVDETVSPGEKYTYVIVYVTEEGRTSKSKSILINN
jgi:fibronectin type 3 domain-containing protein